jgi:predicted nucleic acid-binding protein
VLRRGDAVVVVADRDYEKLIGTRPSFKEFLLGDGPSLEGLDNGTRSFSHAGDQTVRVLLDTCVLSELRHPKGDAGERRAIDAFDSQSLFVSVLSIGEIAKGIALLRESQHKRALRIWLQTLERHYADRLLPVDLETTRIWGELTAAAQRIGRTVPAGDGLIAATARRNGLHVMTRNTADFEPTGVLLLNPWADGR